MYPCSLGTIDINVKRTMLFDIFEIFELEINIVKT